MLCRAALFASCALLAPAALAQNSPTLLVELDPAPAPPGSDLGGKAEVLGMALGRLWLSGTGFALADPVFTVASGSSEPVPFPLPLLGFSETAFASAQSVLEIGAGRALLKVREPGNNGQSYLVGTDGSAAGTELLPRPLNVFALDPKASPVQPGLAFFLGLNANGNEALFRTDGTVAGTIELIAGGFITGFELVGDRVIYVERTAPPQFGTAFELRSVPAAGGPVTELLSGSGTGQFARAGGQLVISCAEPGSVPDVGVEIYTTDGTPAGTGLLLDLQPGPEGSVPIFLDDDGTNLYLSAVVLGLGRELWITDGTTFGTRLVADVLPGPASAFDGMSRGEMLGGGLVFSAVAEGLGREPHFTDGTAAGTRLIADLKPGSPSSNPRDLAAIGGGVFFSAAAPGGGREPFFTDGTVAPLVADLSSSPTGSDPRGFTAFDGRAWFAGTDSLDDREPYSAALDGTGLQPEPELGVAPPALGSAPTAWVSAGPRGYFEASQSAVGPNATGLFVTDGTAVGTERIAVTAPNQGSPVAQGALDQGLLFARTPPDGAAIGWTLWFTDGSLAGVEALPLVANGTAQAVQGIQFAGQLGPYGYLAIQTKEEGLELWRSDGTPAGTQLFVDLAPGPANGLTNFTGFAVSDDRLYFLSRGGEGIAELWATDGTVAGTGPVAPTALGTTFVNELAAFGDGLAFTTNPGGVWVTDGTDAGTVPLLEDTLLRIIALSSAGETVLAVDEPFGSTDEILLAFAPDGSVTTLLEADRIEVLDVTPYGTTLRVEDFNKEFEGLYRTDGTPSGTVRTGPLLPQFAIGSGLEALQARLTPGVGIEAWIADESGSALFVDAAPGPISSDPIGLGRIGDTYLLSAFTLEHGRELHAISVSAAGGFAAEPFGQGCGTLSTPDLAIAGPARIGNLVELQLDDVTPLAPTALYAGLGFGPAPLGSCVAYPAAPFSFAALQASPDGSAKLVFAIADKPAFVGVQVVLQGASLVIGGPALGSYELTNAVEVVFGL